MVSVGGVILLLVVIIVLAVLRQHERNERTERDLRRWWDELERGILEELDDVNKRDKVETDTMQVEGQVHPSDR